MHFALERKIGTTGNRNRNEESMLSVAAEYLSVIHYSNFCANLIYFLYLSEQNLAEPKILQIN